MITTKHQASRSAIRNKGKGGRSHVERVTRKQEWGGRTWVGVHKHVLVFPFLQSSFTQSAVNNEHNVDSKNLFAMRREGSRKNIRVWSYS